MPDSEFKRSTPIQKPIRSGLKSELDPVIPVIIERARAMAAEKPESADSIARSLIADGLVAGTLNGITKTVRQALRRSGEFVVADTPTGQETLWKPWKPTVTSVDNPDGSRVIHTQVLSTAGIPVHVAIPVKPINEIAQILLREPCCGSSGMFVQSVEFIRAHACDELLTRQPRYWQRKLFHFLIRSTNSSMSFSGMLEYLDECPAASIERVFGNLRRRLAWTWSRRLLNRVNGSHYAW